jgi:hypothetical protein
MRNIDQGMTMKRLIALFLLSLTCHVYAGPTCWPKSVGGTGVGMLTGSIDTVGQWRAVWCPGPYRWQLQTWTTAEGYAYKYPPGMESMTLLQALEAAYALNVSFACADQRLCDAAVLAAKTTKPPDPSWVVAKNGTSTTRPMWSAVFGADGQPVFTASTLRANVGVSCDCANMAVMKGTQTQCWLANSDLSEVTYCVKAS